MMGSKGGITLGCLGLPIFAVKVVVGSQSIWSAGVLPVANCAGLAVVGWAAPARPSVTGTCLRRSLTGTCECELGHGMVDELTGSVVTRSPSLSVSSRPSLSLSLLEMPLPNSSSDS